LASRVPLAFSYLLIPRICKRFEAINNAIAVGDVYKGSCAIKIENLLRALAPASGERGHPVSNNTAGLRVVGAFCNSKGGVYRVDAAVIENNGASFGTPQISSLYERSQLRYHRDMHFI
jgi:hypothetical protein